MTNIIGIITYVLSAAGQKADLLAGGNGRSRQTVQGPVSKDTIGLFTVNADGELTVSCIYDTGETPATQSGGALAVFDEPQTFESLIDFMARRRAEIKKEKGAKGEANAARIRSLLADDLWDGSTSGVSTDYVETVDSELLKQFYAERDRRRDAKKEREKEAVAAEFLADASQIPGYGGGALGADGRLRLNNGIYVLPAEHPASVEARRRYETRKSEEAAREAAKAEQVAAWVAEFGDANQKERFAAGVFPRSEAVDALKTAAFAALDARFAPFQRIKSGDVECDCNYTCDLKCETLPTSGVTAEQWERIKAIKAVVPDALAVEVRAHICERTECENSVRRLGAYVKLQIGAFIFNREYAVE